MDYMLNDCCILVNRQDERIGYASKMEAHKFTEKTGTDPSKLPLHRAFSLFLFNSSGEMLLQKRAKEKFTFPGFWSNTCCSHPLLINGVEEPVLDAAVRKAKHELGLDLSSVNLVEAKETIIYSAASCDQFGEHELDHLVFGIIDGYDTNSANAEEVESAQWTSKADLSKWIQSSPEQFTPWFRLISEKLLLQQQNDWHNGIYC